MIKTSFHYGLPGCCVPTFAGVAGRLRAIRDTGANERQLCLAAGPPAFLTRPVCAHPPRFQPTLGLSHSAFSSAPSPPPSSTRLTAHVLASQPGPPRTLNHSHSRSTLPTPRWLLPGPSQHLPRGGLLFCSPGSGSGASVSPTLSAPWSRDPLTDKHFTFTLFSLTMQRANIDCVCISWL